MPDYLSLCDIGIFFIKPVFSKLSSSPVKFAEYLAGGIPVIINRGIGDTDKLVTHYRLGAVLDKFDETSYTNAFKVVLKMVNEEKEALRSRCRETAKKELSLEMAIGRYRRVYEDILKG